MKSVESCVPIMFLKINTISLSVRDLARCSRMTMLIMLRYKNTNSRTLLVHYRGPYMVWETPVRCNAINGRIIIILGIVRTNPAKINGRKEEQPPENVADRCRRRFVALIFSLLRRHPRREYTSPLDTHNRRF